MSTDGKLFEGREDREGKDRRHHGDFLRFLLEQTATSRILLQPLGWSVSTARLEAPVILRSLSLSLSFSVSTCAWGT